MLLKPTDLEPIAIDPCMSDVVMQGSYLLLLLMRRAPRAIPDGNDERRCGLVWRELQDIPPPELALALHVLVGNASVE